MMDNEEFKECVRECTRECEDRECRTDAPGELGEGILFLCSIECEEKCKEECREKLKHLIR